MEYRKGAVTIGIALDVGQFVRSRNTRELSMAFMSYRSYTMPFTSKRLHVVVGKFPKQWLMMAIWRGQTVYSIAIVRG